MLDFYLILLDVFFFSLLFCHYLVFIFIRKLNCLKFVIINLCIFATLFYYFYAHLLKCHYHSFAIEEILLSDLLLLRFIVVVCRYNDVFMCFITTLVQHAKFNLILYFHNFDNIYLFILLF